MVFSRIIILATVLITLEATGDECKFENTEFCELIGYSHDANQDSLELMVGVPIGNGTKALKLADKRVVAVLNTTEEQLIDALKAALRAELSAFVQVKADCFILDHSYNETCEKVFFEVAYAITGLILATINVHPSEGKKNEVDKLLSELDLLTAGFENKAYFLGKEILTII
ncbi:unnamed protein product [Nippostrongylus brasiliensis]|uniref:Secreted protein n=1 Tax=Nippostrongylus brasiliensis TaxID=27835 RepID=A0A0N4YDA0_NIPBR|nr:unnamed protein product [Nippostrongylus brasiliensis]